MNTSKVIENKQRGLKGNNMAQIKIHNGGYYAHIHKRLMSNKHSYKFN